MLNIHLLVVSDTLKKKDLRKKKYVFVVSF